MSGPSPSASSTGSPCCRGAFGLPSGLWSGITSGSVSEFWVWLASAPSPTGGRGAGLPCGRSPCGPNAGCVIRACDVLARGITYGGFIPCMGAVVGRLGSGTATLALRGSHSLIVDCRVFAAPFGLVLDSSTRAARYSPTACSSVSLSVASALSLKLRSCIASSARAESSSPLFFSSSLISFQAPFNSCESKGVT